MDEVGKLDEVKLGQVNIWFKIGKEFLVNVEQSNQEIHILGATWDTGAFHRQWIYFVKQVSPGNLVDFLGKPGDLEVFSRCRETVNTRK